MSDLLMLLNSRANNLPRTVSPGNLKLWLDAADLQTVVKDGSNKVSQWNDKSGNRNNAVQGTGANQPTYTTAGLNGRASIDFDGTAGFLGLGDILNTTFGGTDSKFTVFAVICPDSVNDEGIISKYNTASRQFFFGLANTNKVTLEAYQTLASGNARTVRGNTIMVAGTDYVVSCVYDGSIDSNDGLDRVQFRLNATDQTEVLSSTTGTLGDIQNNGTAHLGVGAVLNTSGAATGSFFDGDIAEIIAYQGVLNSTQIAAVLTYLGNKYGVTV